MIPKQITVGKTIYTIEMRDELIEDKYQGECDYGAQLIALATKAQITTPTGTKITMEYAPEELRDTFWHELTHAILYDMGHHLHSNEHFVSAFANRLSNAIDSAKF